MAEVKEPTASEMDAARKQQIQAVVDNLINAREAVSSITGSSLGGFDLWLGGPPSRIAQVENYCNNTARMIAEEFGVLFTAPVAEPE